MNEKIKKYSFIFILLLIPLYLLLFVNNVDNSSATEYIDFQLERHLEYTSKHLLGLYNEEIVSEKKEEQNNIKDMIKEIEITYKQMLSTYDYKAENVKYQQYLLNYYYTNENILKLYQEPIQGIVGLQNFTNKDAKQATTITKEQQLIRLRHMMKDFQFNIVWSTGHSATHTLGYDIFGTSGPYQMNQVVGVNEYIRTFGIIPKSMEQANVLNNGTQLFEAYTRYKLFAILHLISLGQNTQHYFQAGHDIQFGEAYIYQSVIADRTKYIRLRRNRYETANSYQIHFQDIAKQCLKVFNNLTQLKHRKTSNVYCPINLSAIIPPLNSLYYLPSLVSALWYIDENERQWRKFRFFNPKIIALEIYWDKQGYNLNSKVISKIAEFCNIPLPKKWSKF